MSFSIGHEFEPLETALDDIKVAEPKGARLQIVAATLTEEKRLEIADDKRSLRVVAKDHGVSPSTVSRCRRELGVWHAPGRPAKEYAR